MKKCSCCRINKDLTDFGSNRRYKDGLQYDCKECINLAQRNRIKTKNKDTFISERYISQKRNSKHRGHAPPLYSLNELRKWALSQAVFHKLHADWVASGYKKELVPSFDRTDDYQGYSLDRLTIMTWQENNDKACRDIKNGLNNKINKAVAQFTLKNDFIAYYHSLSEAGRSTGINVGNICSCCKGICKSAGGFNWEYKNPDHARLGLTRSDHLAIR